MSKKEQFKKMVTEAIEEGAKYIFTEMYILGYPSSEVIVNPIDNAQKKVDYICSVYNDDLEMFKNENGNGVKVVEVVSFGYIYDMSQLEYVKANFKEEK